MKRLFYILLFLSCFFSFSCEVFNNNIEDYLKYWTTSVVFAKVDVLTPNRTIDGITYVECKEKEDELLKIRIYFINPQHHKIINDTDNLTLTNLTKPNNSNNSECNEKIINFIPISDYTFELWIKLDDSDENNTFTLSGILSEETEILKEDSKFSWTFTQSSFPDDIQNLNNIKDDTIEGNHYISFLQPDLSKSRNRNFVYEIYYYTPSKEYIKKITVDPNEDNKNLDSNSQNFEYFPSLVDFADFDGQEFYHYKVFIKKGSYTSKETNTFDVELTTQKPTVYISHINPESTESPQEKDLDETINSFVSSDELNYTIQLDELGYNYPQITATTEIPNAEVKIYNNNSRTNINGKNLVLGPNVLEISIVKDNKVHYWAKKIINVTGKLAAPTITFDLTNDQGECIFKTKNSKFNYSYKYKYSFLDFYRIPYTISKQDEKAFITTKINDLTELSSINVNSISVTGNPENNDLSTLKGIPEGDAVKFEVILQRQYCEDLIITNTMNVSIYEISIKSIKFEMDVYLDAKDKKGYIYLQNQEENKSDAIFFPGEKKFPLDEGKLEDITNKQYCKSVTLPFNKYSNHLRYGFEHFRGNIGGFGEDHDMRGENLTYDFDDNSITIESLKYNNWKFTPPTYKNGSWYVTLYFTFVASDEKHPLN